jgi:hypothetical protein
MAYMSPQQPEPVGGCGPIRPLLTIQTLEGPAGGSLYVRDFAVELFRQGHRPSVYCRRLGAVSAELLNFGIPVIDDIQMLSDPPDIIHGNSPIETVAAILRFPETPAIFVGHGWRSPDAIPPKLPNVVRYLAVSEHARDALLCFFGIPADLITVHQNPTDLERFARRSSLPAIPRRALVLSNSISDLNCLGAIESACKRSGLTVDVVGLSMETARMDTESILGDYDVVFAKGRSALDALATGCAVVLADASGFGELVTTDNYDLLRLRNFGLRALCLPATQETALAQLRRYDPLDAAKVTDRVRQTEGLFSATARLTEIYADAINAFTSNECAGSRELTAAAAGFLDTIAPFANTFFLAEHIAPVERALRVSERKLRQLAATLGMKRMDPAELSGLSLEVVACPAEAQPGEYGEAVVRVRNGAQVAISSLGEFPINLSCHWYDGHGAPVLFEGPRSELFPPLLPGQSYLYTVRFMAPSAPGSYVLRLTLVQEAVMWLDQCGVFCDTSCTVI